MARPGCNHQPVTSGYMPVKLRPHNTLILLCFRSMASPAGFEPTAPGLGILCSILLSYGDDGRVLAGRPRL